MKYLAFDIGAREVKAALAERSNGYLGITKVQSFRVNLRKDEGHLIWPIDEIFAGIVEAIRISGPVDFISIDSFASDFVLLDEEDRIIGGAVSYMDERTRRVTDLPDEAWIFSRTGMCSRHNTTLYQLLSLKEEEPEVLNRAVSLMFLPDYLNFLLTGIKMTSRSMALTSALVNAESLTWDDEIIGKLGFNSALFSEITADGEIVGDLKDEIAKEVGYEARIILSGHDTSLAYLSSPMDEETLMLSLGGFARMGALADSPMLSDRVMNAKLSNAVIYGGQHVLSRYLMGTYLIQALKERMKEGTSYDEIMRRARAIHTAKAVDIHAIDFEEKNVFESINRSLEKDGMSPAQDEFEAASVVYSSLVEYYVKEIEAFEDVLGRKISRIAFVGGAVRDQYLALLLAMKSKREVVSGASDAALIGNLILQMVSRGEMNFEEKDEELRKAIGRTIYRLQ